MEHRKLLGASAFAALSLIFVFSTGGFSAQPSLRTQVASLEQEVSNLRASLPAAVTAPTTTKATSPIQGKCARSGYCVEDKSGECIPCTLIKKTLGRFTVNTLADVQAIQTALIEKGYLKGVADGKFGSGTEAAVKAFQKASGLFQSGTVDPATSVVLFSNTSGLVGVQSPIVTPAVTMELISATSSTHVGEGNSDDVGVFRVKFKVIAGENDIYIPNVAAQAVSYMLQRSGTTANLAQGSAAAFGAISGSNLTAGYRFMVPAMTTAIFELDIIAVLPSAGQPGLYRVVANGINWATSDTATPVAYPLTTPYATSYISLN